jgi:GNAT superfamily N-acetyltransferase
LGEFQYPHVRSAPLGILAVGEAARRVAGTRLAALARGPACRCTLGGLARDSPDSKALGLLGLRNSDATMICRRFRPEDKVAVISLLRESIDDWHGEWAEVYWEWKFERNPHGPGRIWVGDDKGRIAGCYIWNPVRVQLGDTTLLGAQSVDAAVHSDYRGHGLFTDLARTAIEDDATAELALVYAFPVEAAFRGQLRVGFKPRLVVSAVHRPLLSGVMRRRRFDGLALSETTSFDSRFDAFSRSGRNSELAVQRDAAYLRWRYFDHPTRRYETIVCERDGEICGYCVLFVDATERLSRGYVVDLQVLPDSEPAAAFLVYHALRRLRSRGAHVAISWVRPPGPEQDGFASLGFSPRYQSIQRRLRRARYVPQFVVFENDPGTLRELLARRGAADPPQWSLVPGDHDSM